MKLWAYGKVQGQVQTHKRIELCDANDLLPFADAKRLMAMGASIAHVSDFVRIMAAGRVRGWIIDCDNIWIRNPPSQSKHAFATLGPYVTGTYAKKATFWQEMNFQVGKEGYWDGKGLINFPCLFEPGEPYALDFVAWAEDKVKLHQQHQWPKGKKSWNMVMFAMRDLIVQHGMQADVHPWWHFSPTPAMSGQRMKLLSDWFDKPAPDRTRYGVTYPSTTRILRLSYCVSVFCNSTSSTFNKDGQAKKEKDQTDSCLYNVMATKPHCLLSKLWKVVQNNAEPL